jgi:hypothetical protein
VGYDALALMHEFFGSSGSGKGLERYWSRRAVVHFEDIGGCLWEEDRVCEYLVDVDFY